MLDVDTFLTTLYVIVDDFCQSHPPKKRPGPQACLCESEIITLAIFARWGRFCFGAASSADQPLAETFFAIRARPNPRLISVGSAFSGTYVADKASRVRRTTGAGSNAMVRM